MSRSGFNKKQKDGGAGLAGGGDNATRAFNSGESYSGGGGGGDASVHSNSVPLAYYDMSDGSGATVSDVSSAGNNLDGTKRSATSGNPQWDSTNKVRGSNSLVFDHTQKDAVIVPDNNLLDFNVNDSFSISCWVKRSGGTPSQEGGWVVKMAQQAGNGDGAFKGYAFYTFDTLQKQPAFLLLDNTGGQELLRVKTTNASLINDTNFHNVIVTYNGNSDLSGVKIYLDGSSVDLTQVDDSLEVNDDILTSTDLTIGAFINNPVASDNTNQNDIFSGNMDEVAIWSKELSQDEVTSIYNSGDASDLTNGIPVV